MKDIQIMDPSGNANETRLLLRIQLNLQNQLNWFNNLHLGVEGSSWVKELQINLSSIGGIHGESEATGSYGSFTGPRFERPRTIVFDERIKVGELATYENRLEMDTREATIEQFKVFFNEFYAAQTKTNG